MTLSLDDIILKHQTIDSIHNIYTSLKSGKIQPEDLKGKIDYVYYCCSSYKTILSYCLTQNINLNLIKELLDNGANIQLEFNNSTTPLYYLFMYQELSVIKIIMEYKNIKIIQIYQLLELCISKNDISKTEYIINNDFSILFSTKLKQIIIKYSKLEWYKQLGKNIFYLLYKAHISKYRNLFSNLLFDNIQIIQNFLFI